MQREIDRLDLKAGMTEEIRAITHKATGKLIDKRDSVHNRQLSWEEVERLNKELNKLLKEIDIDVQVNIEKLINEKIVQTANTLLKNYQQRVKSLSNELTKVEGVNIDPFKLMSSKFVEFKNVTDVFNKIKMMKKVEDGTVKVDNPKREGFFGFFKFWQPSKIEVTKYKNVSFVYGGTFVREYLKPFNDHLNGYEKLSLYYLEKETKEFKNNFNLKFEELNNILNNKMIELSGKKMAKLDIEVQIRSTKNKIYWLTKLTNDLKGLLNI